MDRAARRIDHYPLLGPVLQTARRRGDREQVLVRLRALELAQTTIDTVALPPLLLVEKGTRRRVARLVRRDAAAAAPPSTSRSDEDDDDDDVDSLVSSGPFIDLTHDDPDITDVEQFVVDYLVVRHVKSELEPGPAAIIKSEGEIEADVLPPLAPTLCDGCAAPASVDGRGMHYYYRTTGSRSRRPWQVCVSRSRRFHRSL